MTHGHDRGCCNCRGLGDRGRLLPAGLRRERRQDPANSNEPVITRVPGETRPAPDDERMVHDE